MMTRLQTLINSLRDELQHYGGMLLLLDQQQDTAKCGGSENLLASVNAVNAHSAKIQVARANRRQAQQELTATFDLAGSAGFHELIPLLPEQYRPLLSALVQENNELLLQIRNRAQQNQILLRRCLESMQQFISSLEPQPTTTTPSQLTHQLATEPPGPPLCEAIA